MNLKNPSPNDRIYGIDPASGPDRTVRWFRLPSPRPDERPVYHQSTDSFPPAAPTQAVRLLTGTIDALDPSRIWLKVAYCVGGKEVFVGPCVLKVADAARMVEEARREPQAAPPACEACPAAQCFDCPAAAPAEEISAGKGGPLAAARLWLPPAQHESHYRLALTRGDETWEATGPDADLVTEMAASAFPTGG